MEDYYFLATPLYSFRGDNLIWDEKIQRDWKRTIKILEDSGIKIVVALRDLDQSKSGKWLRKKEFELIEKARGLIVIMGNTPGIYFESGFAKGKGKDLYGIRTEKLIKMGPKVQEWIESSFKAVFDSAEELVKHLER